MPPYNILMGREKERLRHISPTSTYPGESNMFIYIKKCQVYYVLSQSNYFSVFEAVT